MTSPSPQEASRAVAHARERFSEIVGRPDASVGLAEAALWIAAEHQPGLSPGDTLAELDALAERVRAQLADVPEWRPRVERIVHTLFHAEGLRGNADDYYDPENSYLNAVLARRSGIPITLALVFVEVARRLGLEAAGVGFPGHFLAKVSRRVAGGREDIYVDAFHGTLLTREDCKERLQEVMGPEARLEPGHLRAARPKEVLARVLGNLKQIFLARKDLEDALACCDRLLLLAPDAAFEIRDRGVLYHQLECYHAAITDLGRFLELAPSHESAEKVRKLLVAARAQAGALH